MFLFFACIAASALLTAINYKKLLSCQKTGAKFRYILMFIPAMALLGVAGYSLIKSLPISHGEIVNYPDLLLSWVSAQILLGLAIGPILCKMYLQFFNSNASKNNQSTISQSIRISFLAFAIMLGVFLPYISDFMGRMTSFNAGPVAFNLKEKSDGGDLNGAQITEDNLRDVTPRNSINTLNYITILYNEYLGQMKLPGYFIDDNQEIKQINTYINFRNKTLSPYIKLIHESMEKDINTETLNHSVLYVVSALHVYLKELDIIKTKKNDFNDEDLNKLEKPLIKEIKIATNKLCNKIISENIICKKNKNNYSPENKDSNEQKENGKEYCDNPKCKLYSYTHIYSYIDLAHFFNFVGNYNAAINILNNRQIDLQNNDLPGLLLRYYLINFYGNLKNPEPLFIAQRLQDYVRFTSVVEGRFKRMWEEWDDKNSKEWEELRDAYQKRERSRRSATNNAAYHFALNQLPQFKERAFEYSKGNKEYDPYAVLPSENPFNKVLAKVSFLDTRGYVLMAYAFAERPISEIYKQKRIIAVRDARDYFQKSLEILKQLTGQEEGDELQPQPRNPENQEQFIGMIRYKIKFPNNSILEIERTLKEHLYQAINFLRDKN